MKIKDTSGADMVRERGLEEEALRRMQELVEAVTRATGDYPSRRRTAENIAQLVIPWAAL